MAPKADSTGPIVLDSSGNGYVAWDNLESGSGGDAMDFCKIPTGGTCTHPVTLPIPKVDHWDNYGIIQPFPVIGAKAGVVSIVAPSYDYNTVVVWTSKNSGATFSEPAIIGAGSYCDLTGLGDILLAPTGITYPDSFSMAAVNPGLGYAFTGIGAIGARNPPAGTSLNTAGIAGAPDSVTLGFRGQETVEVFGTDSTIPRIAYLWSPVPGVSDDPHLFNGPTKVSFGINPRLSSGPRGLFLLSEDVGSKATSPYSLDVRQWNATTHAFGAPTLVGKVTNDIDGSNPGGFAEDASNGNLYVAWPEETKTGYVMDVWTSTNGGESFSAPTDIGTIGSAYVGPARIAVRGGNGFLTWQDSGGLELVTLKHL